MNISLVKFRIVVQLLGYISRLGISTYRIEEHSGLFVKSIKLTCSVGFENFKKVDDLPLIIFLNEIFKNKDIKSSPLKTTIITGFPRVGKSIIANKLSERFRAYVLKVDQVRKIYWEEKNDLKRQEIRKKILSRIIELFPMGLIIEGDEFISENRYVKRGTRPLSLDFLEFMKNRYDMKVCVIGNRSTTIKEKTSAIKTHRKLGECWTLNDENYVNEENIASLAKKTVEVSFILANIASEKGIAYYDINPEIFFKDVEDTVNLISGKLIS